VDSSTELGRPCRILVVDDHAQWRQLTCSILATRSDLKVVAEVDDGLEAVRKALQLKPDLILLDIGLPNLSGIEAAAQISKAVPETAILFLTQNKDADMAQAVLKNGAKGYVLKTDADRELILAIDAVLEGKQFLSSGLKR
jgi:DNA-binding NarL/FixJ family response regulator